MNTGRYILKDKKSIPEPELLKWGKWMQDKKNRIVKQTNVGNYLVSTVFLGLDYEFEMLLVTPPENYNPLIFETMIFDISSTNEVGFHDDVFDYMERYRTYEEAIEGHKVAVRYVKKEIKK